MKYLRERDEYLKNFKLINEAASNDIEFGDSIVGRLLSGIFRMAKMGVDMKRIDGALARLEKAITNSVTVELQKEPEFKKATDDIERAGLIDGFVAKMENDPKDFAKYLEDLNKEDPELMKELMALPEIAEICQAVIDQAGTGEKPTEATAGGDYNTMIKNLKFLSTILSTYKNVKLEGEPVKQATEPRATSAENLKKKTGETIQQQQAAAAAAKKGKNPPVKQEIVNKDAIGTGAETANKEIHESTLFEALGDPEKGANVAKGESHLTEAFSKLRKSIEALMSPKDKGVGIDVAFINDIVGKANDSKNKETIKSLYKEINRYLVGDKKDTLQQPDALYKESIEVISDKNKMPVVAEKIARFAKRAMQFEGTGLYGGMGDCGKALEQFNATMKTLSVTPAKANESINEGFISDLFNVNVGKGDIKIEGDNNKITQIIYNGKNFDFDAYLKEKGLATDTTSIQKTSKELEGKLEGTATKLVKEAQIDAIEIVRIFNQAGRLIVKTNIPSTRSGGKISVARSNNWETLEGGTIDPQNPKGPVRNIKLFQRWNDGVLKLVKKYEDILKNAKIKTSSGELVKPKYPISKFMVDCLEDNKLFKSVSGRGGADGAGYQKQYLMSHLGIKDEEATKMGESTNLDTTKATGAYEFKKVDKAQNIKGLHKSMIRLSGKFTIGGTTKENISLYMSPIYPLKNNEYIGYISTSDKYFKRFAKNYTAENNVDEPVYLVKFSNDAQFNKNAEFKSKVIKCCPADEIDGAELVDIALKISGIEQLVDNSGNKHGAKNDPSIEVKGFVFYTQAETIAKLSNKLTKSEVTTPTE